MRPDFEAPTPYDPSQPEEGGVRATPNPPTRRDELPGLARLERRAGRRTPRSNAGDELTRVSDVAAARGGEITIAIAQALQTATAPQSQAPVSVDTDREAA